MKLLILGGTVFLGRHLVEVALARGHAITLFNRGQHNADLFPQVEKLRGNRDGDLDALRGKTWDAVIDTCGYVPRIVEASAKFLANAVEHYTFISSISVFPDNISPNSDETAPVTKLPDESVEQVTGETYGGLKALCEQAVERTLPGRALVIRPGLIVGPNDPTDRFTYWPHRIARGGEVLAPGNPSSCVQIIDVRDLAEWTIRMIEGKHVGVFNATGPAYPLTLQQTLDECVRVSKSDARLTWVDEQFLLDHNVGSWIEMPLWVPDKDNSAGMMQINCAKAIAKGLTFRSVADTIRDTIAWDATRPPETEWRAGMKPEREAELLVKWHAR
ncbi:MAG: NAD-dependent epimerase/dehydratase family protein [Chloroflexi bacterium]|nr:NAD-dependent epimerase/dehydratase family protein [Chloroflexota bacterium]